MDYCIVCNSRVLMIYHCCDREIHCIVCDAYFHVCIGGEHCVDKLSELRNGDRVCMICGLVCHKFNPLYHICDDGKYKITSVNLDNMTTYCDVCDYKDDGVSQYYYYDGYEFISKSSVY